MRNQTINLRTTKSERALIDRAATACGRDRTEFMLEAAREKAQEVLLDQTFFVLNKARFASLQAMLDAPVPDEQMKVLREFRRRAAPWEQAVPARKAAAR